MSPNLKILSQRAKTLLRQVGLLCFVVYLGCQPIYAADGDDVYSLFDNAAPETTILDNLLLNNRCNITIHRRFVKGEIVQPLSLPFNLSENELKDESNPLYGATIRKYVATRHLRHNGRDSVVIALQRVNAIEAGRPYFIHWNNGDNSVIEQLDFKNVIIKKASSSNIDTFSTTSATVYANLAPVRLDSIKTDNHRYLYVSDKGEISFFSDIQGVDSIYGFRLYICLSEEKRGSISDDAGFHFGDIMDYYLCLTAVEEDVTSLYLERVGNADVLDLEYSLDNGITWIKRPYDEIRLFQGRCVYYRAAKVNKATGITNGTYNHFASRKDIAASGSIMSLLYPSAEETHLEYGSQFAYLFNNTCNDIGGMCGHLIEAPELTALNASYHCYEGLFLNCKSLKVAPELPATELDIGCYYRMFEGCGSLKNAPVLPAIKTSQLCYGSMFEGCSSLREAPELPATYADINCYLKMFKNCKNLVKTPSVLPAKTVLASCYQAMFENCSSLEVADFEISAATMAANSCTEMFKDCSALVVPPKLPATRMADGCYFMMFDGCTSLKNAPELPATILARQCYCRMFLNCKSLVNAPSVLPVLNLQEGCYASMFEGCSSLVVPPELPATVLKLYCYHSMFKDCSSLTRSPVLPAKSAVIAEVYTHLFLNCSMLDTINVSFRKWPTNGYLYSEGSGFWYWVSGVAPNGVFIAPCELEPVYFLKNFIPRGWKFLCMIDVFDTINPQSELAPLVRKQLQTNIYTNTVKNGSIRPFSLPINISKAELDKPDHPLHGVTIEKYLTTHVVKTEEGKDSVLFVLVPTDSIIAGMPYFIHWNSRSNDTTRMLVFEDIIIRKAVSTKEDAFADLTTAAYANLAPLRIDSFSEEERTKYVYPKDNSTLLPFSAFTSDDSLYGLRCYFKLADTLYNSLNLPNTVFNYGKITDYALCFTAEEDGAIIQLDSICTGYSGKAPPAVKLLYSTDEGKTWLDYSWQPNDGKGITISLPHKNDKVYFIAKDRNEKMHYTFYDNNNRFNIHYQFFMSGKIAASGRIMSLLDRTARQNFVPDSAFFKLFYHCNSLTAAPELTATRLAPFCYANMFEGCISLSHAPELSATVLAQGCYRSMFEDCLILTQTQEVLPGDTLMSDCYASMFKNCRALERMPRLAARWGKARCCQSMFEQCIRLKDVQDTLWFSGFEDSLSCCRMFALCDGLTDAPALPCESLAIKCYRGMFSSCTALRHAPLLPATKLAEECYASMFENCRELNYIPSLPATELVAGCYRQMFRGCNSLDSIRVCFDVWLPADATERWMENVNPTGVFVAPCGLPDIRSSSHVPYDWEFLCKFNLYDDKNQQSDLERFLDSTVTVYLHTHLSKNGGLRAISLPFNQRQQDLIQTSNPLFGATILQYMTTNVFTAADGHDSVVIVLQTVDSMLAGKPYFVQWKNRRDISSDLLVFERVTILQSTNTDDNTTGNNLLSVHPTFFPIELDQISDNLQPNFLFPTDKGDILTLDQAKANFDSLLGYRNFLLLSKILRDSIKNNSPTFHFSDLPLPYLCFISQSDDDSITLTAADLHHHVDLQISMSGSTWFQYQPNSAVVLEKSGDRVYFAAKSRNENFSSDVTPFRFTISQKTEASGNLMSLLDRRVQQNFLPAFAFNSLFADCRNLVSAPQLSATTLAPYVYASMFRNCSSLQVAPDLPATVLDKACYLSMFDGCTQLQQLPALPADSLVEGCYEAMFANCASVLNAPDLAATKLANKCYRKMFLGCSTLQSMPKIYAIHNATFACEQMFKDCKSLSTIFELNTLEIKQGCYKQMFDGCEALINIPTDLLPATKLDDDCYNAMFQHCAQLRNTPFLPATQLAPRCYQNMFSHCTSLSNTPQLNATLLRTECYKSMFEHCSNLQHISHPFPNLTLDTAALAYMFNYCTQLLQAPALLSDSLAPQSYMGLFANCSSLIKPQPNDTLIAMTLNEQCYAEMYKNCSSLQYAPKLPAIQLSNACYQRMFEGCTNLLSAQPDGCLQSTQLDTNCYEAMFKNCQSITKTPKLPAEILQEGCYQQMFQNCINLSIVDTLPAQQLNKFCYAQMFENCTNIDSITVRFDDWFLRYTQETDRFSPVFTSDWLNNTSPHATFIAPCQLDDRRGQSYIPNGWSFSTFLRTVSDTINPQPTLKELRGCADKLQVNRTFFRNRNFNTVSLPFDCDEIAFNASQHPFYGAEIYQIDELKIDGDTARLVFTPSKFIYAGFPYLIRWDNPQEPLVNPMFYDINIIADRIDIGHKHQTRDGAITMLSNFAPIYPPLDNNTYIYMVDGQDLFYYDSIPNDFQRGFRAYFQINDTNLLRRDMYITTEVRIPSTDGIIDVSNAKDSVRKLFINDRIVILKNRKRYSILGLPIQ